MQCQTWARLSRRGRIARKPPACAMNWRDSKVKTEIPPAFLSLSSFTLVQG